jgi:hypothetical protein
VIFDFRFLTLDLSYELVSCQASYCRGFPKNAAVCVVVNRKSQGIFDF